MLILDKIVQIIDRKWQKEFKSLAESLENIPDLEPVTMIDVNEVIQPTHLSRRGVRPIRRRRTHGTKIKPSTKEQSLNLLMREELLKLAK